LSKTVVENIQKLWDSVVNEIPEGRDRSMALVKIEEAGHWLSSALAKVEAEQEIKPQAPLLYLPGQTKPS